MQVVKRLRIFVASPSDVTPERRALQDLVGRLEYDPGLRERAALTIVAWDTPGASTPLLANLDPQAAVRRGLPLPSECDIVVVILWSRFGSPLPASYVKVDGGRYMSGTEWEYLDALEASERTGRPDVLVYRCTRTPSVDPRQPLPELEEAHRQAQLVRSFFETMRLNALGPRGFNSYGTPSEFSALLEEHLRLVVTQQLEALQTSSRFVDLLVASEDELPEVTTSELDEVLEVVLSPREAPHIRALALDSIRGSLPELGGSTKFLIDASNTAIRGREYLVAKAAVRLLGAIALGDQRGSALLLEAAEHPNWEVARQVVREIINVDDEHLMTVAACLRTPVYHVSVRLLLDYFESQSLSDEELDRAMRILQGFVDSASYASSTLKRIEKTEELLRQRRL